MQSQLEIKIRGYHADVFGHVNNARYLEFLEEARWVLLEQWSDREKWAAVGLSFMVVNININYRLALVPGDIAVITTDLSRIGTKSAVLKQSVVDKKSGKVATDAMVTFVLIDSSGKAVEFTEDLRRDIDKLGHDEEPHKRL